MRLLWLTDVHIDHAAPAARAALHRALAAQRADALILTGDVATAKTIAGALTELQRAAAATVYFVLGNHDYYGSGAADERAHHAHAWPKESGVVYLRATNVARLSPSTVLIGVDGWADARLGDVAGTRVRLRDSTLIRELREAAAGSREKLFEAMRSLADDDAARLHDQLQHALAGLPPPRRVIVATHVPPFVEACVHQGRPAGLDYVPFFTCKAIGDVLLANARARADVQFDVLCGHTHSFADVNILPNLRVRVAAAEYEEPAVAGVLIVD
ncbi:hypothetical protein AB1Y20_020982 [Prymnesium parvum]|uniref:Calcineurin-like phosphoesterase domain-containing protein n=1 Tax=Prymnesium parvum TaxID=97485 RepID=A0AB34JI98_PRYPA